MKWLLAGWPVQTSSQFDTVWPATSSEATSTSWMTSSYPVRPAHFFKLVIAGFYCRGVFLLYVCAEQAAVLTRQRFGSWFGGESPGPDHLHLQLAFLIHQPDLDVTWSGDTEKREQPLTINNVQSIKQWLPTMFPEIYSTSCTLPFTSLGSPWIVLLFLI